MSEEKLYSAPRWNDIPQGKTVGHIELTDEDKKRFAEYRKRISKSNNEVD